MRPKEVRMLREELGLTQDAFAALLGLRHRSQVHHLETGRTKIEGAKLILLRKLRDSVDERIRDESQQRRQRQRQMQPA